jgi:hypothetical protein
MVAFQSFQVLPETENIYRKLTMTQKISSKSNLYGGLFCHPVMGRTLDKNRRIIENG